MYCSLDSIDIVTQNEETGRKSFLQTDHRSAEVIQHAREVSTLFALTRVLNARRAIEPEEEPVDVLYVCSEPPPDFLRSVVTSAGGRVQINDEPVAVYEGPIGTPEDLAEDAFRRLAYRMVQMHHASLDESFLSALEGEYAQTPDAEQDEPGYWTRVAELSAVVGELLRARHGGRWVEATQGSTLPFAFRLGVEREAPVVLNVVGRVEQFLSSGERDGLVFLLHTAEDQALADTLPRPVLFTLKPADWNLSHEVLCRPLFPARAGADAPLMAYGEDMPHSFSLFKREGVGEEEVDALHAQALENLRAIDVELQEVQEGPRRVLAVSGHYFAAEKVMDAAFLRTLHERLASEVLLAAVPRKGLLLLTSPLVPPAFLAEFLDLCARQHASGHSAPISPTPLLIQDGLIQGFAEGAERAPSTETDEVLSEDFGALAASLNNDPSGLKN
ncbi:MAG: hypothetical protein ABW123_01480 [Cystobacter sp.]